MSEVLQNERLKDLSDIKNLMDTQSGRRIVWRVLERGKVFSTTFNVDAPTMAFLEGQRNVALELLADVMETAPKKFQVMMLEAKERRELVDQLMDKERERLDEDN
jgi:hypothetical protein